MGIINITPDSFYGKSRCENRDSLLDKAKSLLEAGADILDLGAESTRPGARAITEEEEQARLLPALKNIRHEFPQAVVSVDTRNASTAAIALELGASIINDISGGSHDKAMIDVLREYKPGFVLMHSSGDPEHMQDNPVYSDVLEEIGQFFMRGLDWLDSSGLPLDRVILDPGIGFGKTAEHNLAILRNISHFAACGRPLMAAISMKSFFEKLWGFAIDERQTPTALVSAMLFERGCQWHRVHEAKQTKDALRIAETFASS